MKTNTKKTPNGKDYKPDIRSIQNDLKALKEDTAILATHAYEDGRERIDSAVHYANDGLNGLKETGSIQMKKVEAEIKARPMQSLAIAFGAGIVASMLFGRR